MSGPTGANYPSSGAVAYAPMLYSNKVMKLFTESCVANQITNNDYEGEIKGQGDSVTVRVAPTTMTVGTYAPATPVVYEIPTANARILNIDQAKYAAFQIDEVDKVQSDLQLMSMFAERAANSLKIAIDTDVLGVMAVGPIATNKGATAGKISAGYNLGVAATPIQITKDTALDYIADLASVLDEADVPNEGRFIVIPSWFGNMLKKGDLKRADVTGDASGVVRTGLLGEIDRFKVYQSNLVKHVTDAHINSPEAFYVTAGVMDATTFASQVTKTETMPDPAQFGELWRSLLVYGRKVIMPEALAVLYCTKDSLA